LAQDQDLQDRDRALNARLRFIRTQSVKGGLGIVLSLGYLALIGGPDVAETLAFLGLIAPVGLALAARGNIRSDGWKPRRLRCLRC